MGFFRRSTDAAPEHAAGRFPGECAGPAERAGPDNVAVAETAADAAAGERWIQALAGLREPIVVLLLTIAFFTWISGKPLDGVLLAFVASGMAWDAGRRARQRAAAAAAGTPAEPPGGVATQLQGKVRLPLPLVAAVAAGGALYAAVVGSFSRYSWPATAGVIGLGAAVVTLGWRGPLRRRPGQQRAQPGSPRRPPGPARGAGPLPLAGTLAWAALFVAGCLWELASLLQQPNLTTDSYAHPTISTLTDPLLASHGGRSFALGAWLALGWYLVKR